MGPGYTNVLVYHRFRCSHPKLLFNQDGWVILELIITGAAIVAAFAGLIYFTIIKSRGSQPSVLVLGTISLALTAGALYEVVQMQRKRNIIKALAGSAFEANAWGFGQVLSIVCGHLCSFRP